MKNHAFLFKCAKVFFWLFVLFCFVSFFQFNFLFVENHHYFPLTPYCFEVIFLSFRFHNSRLPVLSQHACFSIVRL